MATIDIAAVDWVFLSQIASAYTTVRSEGGRACLVLPAPLGASFLGEAAKWEGGRAWSVRLRLDQTPAELERVFWHELGHLVSEHPPQRADGDTKGISLGNLHTVEDEAWRARLEAHLHLIEAEADALGAALQADFTARHGPIERLAIKE
jgi:hypothetical protein